MNIKTFFQSLLLAVVASFLTGCMGAASHNLQFRAGYVPSAGTRVEVAPVVNDTGEQFDFDVVAELHKQLELELTRQHLDSATTPAAPRLTIHARIVHYEKGNAAGRWIAPGLGGTRLIVMARLVAAEGEEVGTARVVRSVETGGLYSVGQWKAIFATVAKDLVDDLKSKLKG